MVRSWVAWGLFVSSYAPLFVLLVVQSLGRPDAEPVLYGCSFLLVLGAGVVVLFLQAAKTKAPGRYQVISTKRRDADVASYAVSYVLPFVGVVSDGWRDQVSLALFFGLLGFIYTRSRMIYVNPVLLAMGYELTEITVVTEGATASEARHALLLSDADGVDPGGSISAVRVTSDLLLINQRLE